jgi:hypothetical protein
MPAFNLDAWVARSGALDLSAVPWEDVPCHPIGPEKIGTLRPLAESLGRVIVDESRQFLLCFRQAETPLRGFASAEHLEAWMNRNIGRSSSVSGGHNGHGHH